MDKTNFQEAIEDNGGFIVMSIVTLADLYLTIYILKLSSKSFTVSKVLGSYYHVGPIDFVSFRAGIVIKTVFLFTMGLILVQRLENER